MTNPSTRCEDTHRLTVAVLFGGKSSEYEVSLQSADFVLKSLTEAGYNCIPIGITREGVWKRFDGDPALIPADRWDSPELPAVYVRPGCPDAPFACMDGGKPVTFTADVVFPVLHGKNGEDGTVQGVLQLCGIPFVGCDPDGSAACMNKVYTHRILDAAGIPTAPWLYCTREDMADFAALEVKAAEVLGYPIFVKPARAGSSVGVSKVKNGEGLRAAVELALREDEYVLLEQTLTGLEVECAVLGNRELFATAPAEIVSAAEFYDYAAKYSDIGSEVIIPARLSPALTERVKATAKAAYKALLCKGLSRVDMFAREDGFVAVNEVNTLPGFTAISGYPAMMRYERLSGAELCRRLVALALEGN